MPNIGLPIYRSGSTLNANELLIFAPFSEEGGAFTAHALGYSGNNKTGECHAAKMSEIVSSEVQPYMFELESDTD